MPWSLLFCVEQHLLVSLQLFLFSSIVTSTVKNNPAVRLLARNASPPQWFPKSSSIWTSSIWHVMAAIWEWECGSMWSFFELQCSLLTRASRIPEDNSKWKDSLDYYIWLAKLAEKGKITGIFFADIYGVHDSFPGQSSDQFRSGATCGQLDPIVFVSAMAAVSKSVSFGITGSTSYINVRTLAPWNFLRVVVLPL